MIDKIGRYLFSPTLLIINLYFIFENVGCSTEIWFQDFGECLGRAIGISLGTLLGGAFYTYIYFFLRKIFLKQNFPNDLVNFILYSSIIFSATSFYAKVGVR